jgi:hypothetical protein
MMNFVSLGQTYRIGSRGRSGVHAVRAGLDHRSRDAIHSAANTNRDGSWLVSVANRAIETDGSLMVIYER